MTIFLYRAFHRDVSAGVNCIHGFHAGVRESDYQDPDDETVAMHFDKRNRDPTPWISTTSDILRAIKRALQLARYHGSDGVYIAIIDLDECEGYEFHRATCLANRHDLEIHPWHQDEFMFRWRIPMEAMVCRLTLNTLISRGLYTELPEIRARCSVEAWKEKIMNNWVQVRPGRYFVDVGRKAARFAFLFGDGEHTEFVGLEAAAWWEARVGRIVKGTLFKELRKGTVHADCFD